MSALLGTCRASSASRPGAESACQVQVHWCHLGEHACEGLPRAVVLTAHEDARWQRLAHAADRDRLLGSRLLAKAVLGEARGIAPSAVALGADQRGRPLLTDEPSRCLSLSHSGRLVALAVSPHDVGIDVESGAGDGTGDGEGDREETIEILRLAERHFSTGEFQALSGLAPARRQQAFLSIWTAKEALVKASGISLDSLLTWDLSALVAWGGEGHTALAVGSDWVVESLGPWHGCTATLARPLAMQAGRLQVREWTLPALVAAWGLDGGRS
jgi:phosphopantetheinyl transferase